MDVASYKSGPSLAGRRGGAFPKTLRGKNQSNTRVRHLWQKFKEPRAYASCDNLAREFDDRAMRSTPWTRVRENSTKANKTVQQMDTSRTENCDDDHHHKYVLPLQVMTIDKEHKLSGGLPSPEDSLRSENTLFSSSLMPDLPEYEDDCLTIDSREPSPMNHTAACAAYINQPTPESSPERSKDATPVGLSKGLGIFSTPNKHQDTPVPLTPLEVDDDELVIPEEAAHYAHLISKGHSALPSLSHFTVERHQQPSMAVPAKSPLRYSRLFANDVALDTGYLDGNPYLSMPDIRRASIGIPAKSPLRYPQVLPTDQPFKAFGRRDRNSRQGDLLDWSHTLEERFGLLDEFVEEEPADWFGGAGDNPSNRLRYMSSMIDLRSDVPGSPYAGCPQPRLGHVARNGSTSDDSMYHDALDRDIAYGVRTPASSFYAPSITPEHLRFGSISTARSSEYRTSAMRVASRERNVNGCAIIESANSNTEPLPMERRKVVNDGSKFKFMRTLTTIRRKKTSPLDS
jgi:hypothetical protein